MSAYRKNEATYHTPHGHPQCEGVKERLLKDSFHLKFETVLICIRGANHFSDSTLLFGPSNQAKIGINGC